MRPDRHRCYTCNAEAMMLCHRCTAKSCLDHLTTKTGTHAYHLLCSDCITAIGQKQKLAMWSLVGLAAVSAVTACMFAMMTM